MRVTSAFSVLESEWLSDRFWAVSLSQPGTLLGSALLRGRRHRLAGVLGRSLTKRRSARRPPPGTQVGHKLSFTNDRSRVQRAYLIYQERALDLTAPHVEA